MSRRVSEVGEGTDGSNGVYGLIRDLLVEGKDAWFVKGSPGRYVLNWSRALDRYADYKARKNPHFKSKNLSRRKASNGLRSALLNFYKKEGAKEYKEFKKVNDKDEVVERQFQMPPRVFESLFGNTVPSSGESGLSEQEDEQEINSITSEGDIDAQSTPNSSDHGFDETMDFSCCDLSGSADRDTCSLTSPDDLSTIPNVDGSKTDVSILSPDAAFHHAQLFDTPAVDSALDEICSDGISDEIIEDLDLLKLDICPTSGSLKGGYIFYISLTEPLSEDVSSGMAKFEGVDTVPVHKLNNAFTLTGVVPASDQPGDVPVTVMTQSGQRLGMTFFRYVDEMREVTRQLVHDPEKQALWFAIWCQEYGFFGTDGDSYLAQVLDPLNIKYQDSSIGTKQQHSVKVLQLLVYTAAETNAQQFIEMIFSTSAGRIVFDSYKNRTQLPEDVARANGHNECAQYLQDLTKRLSKETECEDRPKTINWLELVKAVQNETSVSSGSENKGPGSSVENDDNTSDYFADAETSSLGSMEPDDGCPSDSEEEDAANKGLKSTFGFSRPFSDDTSCNGRFHKGPSSIHISDEDFKKGLPPFKTGSLASLVSCVLNVLGLLFLVSEDNASSEGRCCKEPKCLQDNNTRSSRRRYSGRIFKGILLAGALSVLVAVFMLRGSSTHLNISELGQSFQYQCSALEGESTHHQRLFFSFVTPGNKSQTFHDLVCLMPDDPLLYDCCQKNIEQTYFHKLDNGYGEFVLVTKYGRISSCDVTNNYCKFTVSSKTRGLTSSQVICTIMSTGTEQLHGNSPREDLTGYPVGCTWKMVNNTLKDCLNNFYKQLENNPQKDCRHLFSKTLISCVQNIVEKCKNETDAENLELLKARSDDIIAQRSFFCTDGMLNSFKNFKSQDCPVRALEKARKCAQSFYKTFRENKGSPSLCRKFKKTKRSILQALERCKKSRTVDKTMAMYRDSCNPHCLGGQDANRKSGQLVLQNLSGPEATTTPTRMRIGTVTVTRTAFKQRIHASPAILLRTKKTKRTSLFAGASETSSK